MIGNNYKFKNQLIENENDDFDIILRDDLNPRGLENSDENQDLPAYHGVLTSGTFSRGRLIIIEGFIQSKNGKEGFGKGISYLDKLFALQATPSKLKLEEFSFTDDEGNEWSINCKIKNAIEYRLYEDDSSHFLRGFRVVLFGPEGNYFSKDEIIQDGGLNGFDNGIIIENIPNEGINFVDGSELVSFGGTLYGNQPIYIKIFIELLQDVNGGFLKIKNNTTGDFIRIDGNYLQGDEIIIDNFEETILLNGVNIITDKTFGDFFESNIGDFIEIFDVDERYLNPEKLKYSIVFKSLLL